MNLHFHRRLDGATKASTLQAETTVRRKFFLSDLPPASIVAPVLAAVVSAAVVTAVAADVLREPSRIDVLVTRTALQKGQELYPADVRALSLPPAHVPPGTLTELPRDAWPLYARMSLAPGMPLTPLLLSPSRPRSSPKLSAGEVGVEVTVPASTLPGALQPGTQVALAGAILMGGTETLLAMRAQVLGVSALAGSNGIAPSDQVTLSLPIPVALAVAAADRNGTLSLFPWSVPASPSTPGKVGGLA